MVARRLALPHVVETLMKFVRVLCVLTGLGFLGVAAGPSPMVAEQKDGGKKSEPRIVKKILKVEFAVETIDPPNLIVTVTGQVPTGGYDKNKVNLVRVAYVTPPADGIQDYVLFAVPPSGFATQVISEVKAGNRWKGYAKEAPWIKGIRVHGADEGVVVQMLPKGK